MTSGNTRGRVTGLVFNPWNLLLILPFIVLLTPLYNRESVRAAVQAAVETTFGYDAVDFGQRISIGDVYRSALSVDGVDYIILNTLRPVGSASLIPLDIGDTSFGVEYPRMMPRIDPNISPLWVTATGGLVNS